MRVDKARIAALIPHAGAMCLLDEIVSWDSTSIRSRSATHRAADNPLRAGAHLPVWSGIEYAAQTMAVHGALAGAVAARPRAGFLVSLRNVVARAPYLDGPDGELTVEAERMGGDTELVVYAFTLKIGEREMLSGTAAVVLDARTA